jgi:hypothetical protein
LASTPAVIMVMIVATRTLKNAIQALVSLKLISGQRAIYQLLQDTLTDNGHPVDLLHSTRQGSKETNHKADHTKDKGAGTMVGQYVHQDVESQDVAGHEEDKEQKLANSEHLTTDATHQELTSVSHAVDVGVTELELTNGITGIPGKSRDEKNHNCSTDKYGQQGK